MCARPLPLPGPAAGTARPMSLVWCMPVAVADRREALPDAELLAELQAEFGERNGRVVSIRSRGRYPLVEQAREGVREHRLVHVGNAAQTLHPVAGQGLNLGLRDAFELVQVLRHATDIDAALQRVEWARAADRWSMIAATDFLARSFTWQLPGLAVARGLGLAALQGAAPLKSLLARRMMFGSR